MKFSKCNLLITITSLIMFSCNSSHSTQANYDKAVQRADTTHSDTLWNADYSLMKEPEKVVAFRLNPSDKPDSTDVTIAGFKIIGKGVTLSEQQRNTVQFLALSPLSYNHKDVVYKKLFLPSVAYGFYRGNDAVFLLVDLSTDEWALASKDKLLQHQFSYCQREFLQMGIDLFPNDEYFLYLTKNLPDNEK